MRGVLALPRAALLYTLPKLTLKATLPLWHNPPQAP